MHTEKGLEALQAEAGAEGASSRGQHKQLYGHLIQKRRNQCHKCDFCSEPVLAWYQWQKHTAEGCGGGWEMETGDLAGCLIVPPEIAGGFSGRQDFRVMDMNSAVRARCVSQCSVTTFLAFYGPK